MNLLDGFRLADRPLLLLGLLALVVLFWRPRRGGAEFGAFALARAALGPSRGPLVSRALAAAGIACLALAAARPQYGRAIPEREQAGRDLMLVIDLSRSMSVDDMSADGKRCDRLAAVVTGAKAFIAGRPNDRIGLVIFSTNVLTSCPLTFDHATVVEFLDRIEHQQRAFWQQGREGIVGDGTNLGLGIGRALAGLTQANAEGRAIILITDGRDSPELPNWIDPLVAARHSLEKKVTVHCMGVGDPHGRFSQQDPFGRVYWQPVPRRLLPDPERLADIARLGGGTTFSATDGDALRAAFAKLDELEPTSRKVRYRDDFADRFLLPLTAGFALFGIAFALDPALRGVA